VDLVYWDVTGCVISDWTGQDFTTSGLIRVNNRFRRSSTDIQTYFEKDLVKSLLPKAKSLSMLKTNFVSGKLDCFLTPFYLKLKLRSIT